MEEQHIKSILDQNFDWKTGDSILLDLKERGILTERSYEVVYNTKHSRYGIWESKFGDLVKLGDSLALVMDTIPSMQQESPFAFDVPENTTWRDFRKSFKKKGYTLHQIMDTYSPRFVKNPKFDGSGCPLMENPDYHRIIPSSIVKTDPEAYKKVDPETGFVYLYSNHFKQHMYGDIGHAEVELDFFGDTLIALEYYIYNTPNLHNMFIEKYGTPVYNRTHWSSLNGSDSIDVMIWEFKNMRIKYIGYLRKSYYNDMPHSVRVISEHKRRAQELKEYAPKLAAKQKEDSDKWWEEYQAEQKREAEAKEAKQRKVFKDAI